MPSTPIDRLLTKPVTLILREFGPDEDDWGTPIAHETRVDTTCYVRWRRATDRDEDGTVMSEWWELILPADTPMRSYDAVELDGDQYEVIGRPDREWNPRMQEINHVKLNCSRARP